MREWYCFVEGLQYGPVSEALLRAWVRQGRLKPGDLVWTEGMTDWAPAATVGGLFGPAGGPDEAQQYPRPGVRRPGNGLCIAGMVLGILSLTCFCVPVVNLGVSLTGLILSITGIRRAGRQGGGAGMGVAGLVMSIIGLLIAAVVTVLQIREMAANTWPMCSGDF